jgi:hypothetical protein
MKGLAGAFLVQSGMFFRVAETTPRSLLFWRETQIATGA